MSWLRRTQMTDDGAAALAMQEFGNVVERAFPVDDDALARVRAGVLSAFIEATADDTATAVHPQATARRAGRFAGRRAAAASLAVVALLAVSTVAVQARPGAPFYAIRLAAESVLLVPLDAQAGWQARLDRLDRRMTEAVEAGAAGDVGAITASLDEYRSEFAGLTAGLTDATRRASLTAAATRDLARLTALQGANPTDAGMRLTADLEVFLGIEQGPSPAAPVVQPTTPAGPSHPAVNGDPHEDGTTGNPHADGTTGNPHEDGATGDPHQDGAKGNPHQDGPTGNPHQDGAKGNPHQDGAKGDPHTVKPGKPGKPSKDKP